MAFDFEKNLSVIARSVASMDMSCYGSLVEDCLDALKAGRRIIVSGLGKNVPVCEKFVSSMRSVGLDAAFIHTSDAFHGDLGIVKEGDVVIILSKSGKTPESLHLEQEGGPWNIMPMNSTIVYLFILQGIVIDLVNRLGIKLKDFKTNHPGGGIGQKLLDLQSWNN
jgi:arabinose-5-phosphate isomerase